MTKISMLLKVLNSICPGWQAEYRFHSTRKWRFDYANVNLKVAIEIEGGVFSKGRHVRGTGYIKDMQKYNSATKLGWKVLRYTPTQIPEMQNDIHELLRGGA